MSTPVPRRFPTTHPLLDDEDLREHLLDLMWARIQKTISPGVRPKRRSPSTADLQLAGGIGAQDVLSEAFADVLYFEPSELKGSWAGLATTIAHNKAVQAIRDNTKGRRRGNQEVDLISIDQEDEYGHSVGDDLSDVLADPEAEALELSQELAYRRIAEQVLSDRDREIYYRIHNLGEKRSDICSDYNLTPQGVGQIYAKSALRIHEASGVDPEFLRISDSGKGGTE